MNEYTPDWGNIPKEFKYCYVDSENRKMLTTHHSAGFSVECVKYTRPPELVDGAWYAVTIYGKTLKLIMKYTGKHNFLWNHEGFAYRDLIVHKRIPDDMWESV